MRGVKAIGDSLAVGDWVILACQGILGTVFIVAGIYKLDSGPRAVATALNVLNWLPLDVVLWLARLLPWFEVGLALWIVSGLIPRTSVAASRVVLLGFCVHLVAMGRAIGWRADCGCTGPFTRTTVLAGLVRNLVLIAIAGFLFRLLLKRRAVRADSTVVTAVT